MMEDCRRCNANANGNNTAVGFCLLPSELLQSILLHLCLPDIIRMKLVNRYIFRTISDRHFIREFNTQSRNNKWLFVYARRWRRDAIIHVICDCSKQWFKITIAELLKQVMIFQDEDLYFLTASCSFFLFASNTSNGIIAVDLVTKIVRRLPPCPLGPRGTSSWRRSSMKLLAGPPGSGQFRFLFVEMVSSQPVLFIYDSETELWQSKKGEEIIENCRDFQETDEIFLNVLNRPHESIVMRVVECESKLHDDPVVLRPRFSKDASERRPVAIGFSRSNRDEQFQVYGDGYTVRIRLSDVINEPGIKKTSSIEVWSISSDGRKWELVTRAPSELIKKMNKPCGVMMGCVCRRRSGMISIVLMSNLKGKWNVFWLNYEVERDKWDCIPLPHCSFFEGSIMAGITLSSGLTLS